LVVVMMMMVMVMMMMMMVMMLMVMMMMMMMNDVRVCATQGWRMERRRWCTPFSTGASSGYHRSRSGEGA
jgi:hypothetical protein